MDDNQLPFAPPATHDTPAAPAEPQSAPAGAHISAAILGPTLASERLAESVIYRPGALVAATLLAGPLLCALAVMLVALTTGSLPLWLPLALLLWLPLLALAWTLLKSVRVTPDTLSCGRPLGQWRIIPFHQVERVEWRGPRLVVRVRSGRPLSFAPRLLRHGDQLRRSLLLRLPLSTLSSELRAEAQALSSGDRLSSQEGDITGVLTVRPRLRWRTALALATVALLALAIAALVALTAPLSLALGAPALALAIALAGIDLWLAQEIFVSEKGLIIHYALLRRERIVYWAQVRVIEYLPGEVALALRGAHATLCAGPGLLSVTQARLMRRYINRYSLSLVAPLWSRQPR